MGHRRHRATTKSHTLPSSPTHSFSSSASSEFEFAVAAVSPRKSSATVDLCPADDLFYKGKLLPLHLSPRLSMVRTLILSSASTSSSSETSTTTASRDSTASTDSSSADLLLHHHLDCDSGRPSSAAAEDLKRLAHTTTSAAAMQRKPSKYFSLPKLFRKDYGGGGSAVKRVSSGAREVILKYFKKVKPLYEKLSQKAPQQQKTSSSWSKNSRISSSTNMFVKEYKSQELNFLKEEMAHSFSGNLRLYNRGRSCFSSCPSSMGSSPSHGKSGYGQTGRPRSGIYDSDSSSMEELQNAIQGAILHCKNSMLQSQNQQLVSNEF